MSSSSRSCDRIRRRTRKLRRALDALDYVASGTLLARTKVCGRPNCCCANDPSARHGPYHEWTRRRGGRLLHSVVSSEQAKLIERAIANYRQAERILGKWERETEAEILETERDRDS